MSNYIEFNQIIADYIELYQICIFVFIYSLSRGPGRSWGPGLGTVTLRADAEDACITLVVKLHPQPKLET